MKKTFEGVFRRFIDDPSPLNSILESFAQQDEQEKLREKLDALPKHERFKTNGDAFFALQDILHDTSYIPRDNGAEIKTSLKMDGDDIRLTIEVSSQTQHASLFALEAQIRHAIENRHGKFTDISSGHGKAQ